MRAQTVRGGAHRAGLAALCYHGMVQGLRLLAAEPAASEPSPTPRRSELCTDAVVRQLANMILRVQSEAMHVY